MITPTPQAAFLLHSRPYQENKLLVELLTEQEGKVAAVVYSGKTAKSNKKPYLQPFLPLTVALKGKHQLKTIQSIDANGKSLSMTGEPLYCGFYINELLVRLMPEHVPCTWLYQQYQQTITQLANEGVNQAWLRRFELALLDELGIGLNFEQLNEIASDDISFSLEHGFITAQQGMVSYSKQPLLAIAEQRFIDSNTLYTAKCLMRNIINQLLGNKSLNSRKLFERGIEKSSANSVARKIDQN